MNLYKCLITNILLGLFESDLFNDNIFDDNNDFEADTVELLNKVHYTYEENINILIIELNNKFPKAEKVYISGSGNVMMKINGNYFTFYVHDNGEVDIMFNRKCFINNADNSLKTFMKLLIIYINI